MKVLARQAKDLFRADSSYVVVGGLGGLGQSLVRWMSTHGAKNLIVLSRSGMKHALAKQLSSDLERGGCRVLMPECDITDGSLVKEVLSAAEKVMPPIRGVIQAAMVLNVCSVSTSLQLPLTFYTGLYFRAHVVQPISKRGIAEGSGDVEPTPRTFATKPRFLCHAFLSCWHCR